LPDIISFYSFFFDIFGVFEVIVIDNVSAAPLERDSKNVVIGNYIFLNSV